jgi:hypothetical protein
MDNAMQEPPLDVVFRVPTEDVQELLRVLKEEPSLNVEMIRSAGSSGGGEFATVLVGLAPAALSFIAGIVTAWLARPRVSIEADGIKVTGVSRKLVEEILRERLLESGRGPADKAGGDV